MGNNDYFEDKLTPQIEEIIQTHLNSPLSIIKDVYPAIDYIDFEYMPLLDTHLQRWVKMDIYLKDGIINLQNIHDYDNKSKRWETKGDLVYDMAELDTHYLYDHHMSRLYKMLGVNLQGSDIPYNVRVFIPRPSSETPQDLESFKKSIPIVDVFIQVDEIGNIHRPD